jgi:hypothetical protein
LVATVNASTPQSFLPSEPSLQGIIAGPPLEPGKSFGV